ncbi:hypothetical protein ACFW9N_45400 [Streptomyces sp. NPDC059496]|uniref:hypothetical protein n=1 Tax=Streptomyces sp. NPDC059496 TaxID=3346851 RepID=UPI0036786203
MGSVAVRHIFDMSYLAMRASDNDLEREAARAFRTPYLSYRVAVFAQPYHLPSFLPERSATVAEPSTVAVASVLGPESQLTGPGSQPSQP